METSDAGLLVPDGTLPTITETWSIRDTRRLEAAAEMFQKKGLLFSCRCPKCESPTMMAYSKQVNAYKLACKCTLRILPRGRKG